MDTRATFPVTPETKVHRQPARASYDRALAYSILDEALVASVGFVEGEQPFVIPMAFARWEDELVLHAATASRFHRRLAEGPRLCVTVTLLDALVLARSAMHHSLNYRSVIVIGRARELVNERDKVRALARLVDHVLPRRSGACRPPNTIELRATRVFALPLEQVSVKRRTGGVLDDEADLELPYWGGLVPLEQRALEPEPDSRRAPLGEVPPGVSHYDRGAFARAAQVEEVAVNGREL